MDIVLTDEQSMLKQSARAFLHEACPKDVVRAMEIDQRGYPPHLWQRMAALGWLAWPFPSRYGGADGDFFELALLAEELGYAAAPTPFFASIVLGGLVLLEAGTAAQKRALLPKVATGEVVLSLAYMEAEADAGGSIAATAEAQDEGFILRGTKCFVPNAHIADHLLCVVRTRSGRSASRGVSLFLINPQDPSVRLHPMSTVAADKLYTVTLIDLQVEGEALIGRLHRAGRPLQYALLRATALQCAEMVGGAQAVLDMTLDYVKHRVQFGRPIGAFQAVQHHCADMYRELEMSRLLAYQACWYLGHDLPATASVAAAKLKVSRAYPAITQWAHQVTGGVGYYTEYPLELYTRRALAAASTLGGPTYHATQLAEALWG